MEKHSSSFFKRIIQIAIIATVSFSLDYLIFLSSDNDSIWLGESVEIVGSVMCAPWVGGIATLISCNVTDYLSYGTFEYSFISIFEALSITLIGVIYRRLIKDEYKFGLREITIFNFVQILVNICVLYLSTPPSSVLFFSFIIEDWTRAEIAEEMVALENNAFSACISLALIGTVLLAICTNIRKKIKENGSLSAALRSILKVNYINSEYRSRAALYSVGIAISIALTMVDGVVSGQILGADALAATSVVFPLISFSAFVSMLFTSGCSNLAAIAKGNGDHEKGNRLFTLGLLTTVALGLLQSGLFFVGQDLYFGYFTSTDEIEAFARDYYQWFVLAPPFIALTTFLDEIVSADGDDTLSYAGYLISFIVNVAASIILSKSMGMGGLALGTVLSYACFLIVVSLHFFKKSNSYKLKPWFSVRDLLAFAEYSLKSNTSGLCIFVASTAFTKCIPLFLGTQYLIANTVLCAMLEMYKMLNGPSEAAEYLLATYSGEKNGRGIKILFNEALILCTMGGLIVSIIILLFPNLVLTLYGIEDSPLSEELILCIRFCSVGAIAASVSEFLTDFYGDTGKPLWACLMIVFHTALFPILFCVTLCLYGGIVSMGIGMLLGQIFAIPIFFGFVLVLKGSDSIPYMLDDPDYDKVRMEPFEFTPEEYERITGWIRDNMAEQGVEDGKISEMNGIVLSLLKQTGEKQGKKKVLGECVLRFIDEPEIIIKDNGELFEPDINDDRLSYNVLMLNNCSTITCR